MDLSAIYESLLSLSPELSSGPEALWAARPCRPPGRSSSLVEGRSCAWVPPPPPGFKPLAPRPEPAPASPPAAAGASSRYKTELCRTFSESGRCRYGSKCQFAHGPAELRQANRHPKYKTELCHKFYLQGRCPYGARCHFIHNPSEDAAAPRPPHVLRQSVSFSGRGASPPPGLPGPCLSAGSFSPPGSPPPPADLPLSPSAFSAAPGTPVARREPPAACCPSCRRSTPAGLWGPLGGLARSPSAHSLGSDADDYASSGSSLGGSDSPVFEAGVFGPPQPPAAPRRLPIFNRISVSE